jgi:hypothetical protein
MSTGLDKLTDLARWNRAGLARFQYVDGDAALWLEELRIAMLGLVARGAELDRRTPEYWRDLFMREADQWPSPTERAAFEATLAWQGLARGFPDQPETAAKRNARLLTQYADAPGEYGWEVMRAFARAAHVLLGHLNAYANEGYLRTATQWDNLRKLAAMVNHQPAPPTSAITTVGLILEPTGEVVEIARGLAMKYTPPEGGAPVVFETLGALEAHEDLNGARAAGWNHDPTALDFTAATRWIASKDATLSPGALAVLARVDGVGHAAAVQLASVSHDTEAERAELTFDPDPGSWIRGDAALHIEPKDVRRGLPRTTTDTLVVAIETASNYAINSIIRLHHDQTSHLMEVLGNADGHLKLRRNGVTVTNPEVVVETLVPFGGSGLTIFTSPDILEMFFLTETDNSIKGVSYTEELAENEDGDELPGKVIAHKFIDPDVFGVGYAPVAGAKRENGVVIGDPPEVVPGSGPLPGRTIRFAGKPPKGLAIGDAMVMRPVTGPGPSAALRIAGLKSGADLYYLQFDTDVTATPATFEPDRHEFHGPMTRTLRPEDWDRNPLPALTGAEAILSGLAGDAKELLRPGRPCLIEDERGGEDEGGCDPVQATIAEALEDPTGFKVVFDTADEMGGFQAGWTRFRLNAVTAGHGETKSPKTLGSGDGERARQGFAFPAKRVSFVPASVAEAGIAPDMDVSVDGNLWSYRDLIDPTAEGAESWSVTLNEDDSLRIHFRRRLPTGPNNIAVTRYRVGVGAEGAVPARAFTKPMKKNRHVAAISQPFPATGGAEREPVSAIRVNAPARLAANGRAVSVEDFARLCRRRSDVWQARARLLTDPALPEDVGIVLVLANGTKLADNPTLATEITEFVEARALPGTRVRLQDFRLAALRVAATIQVDVEQVDKAETQEAAHAALVSAFSLEQRALGQAAYIAEATAALERVPGVSSATIQAFELRDGEAILRTATTAGKISALFPFPDQVIAVETGQTSADVTVAVEAL